MIITFLFPPPPISSPSQREGEDLKEFRLYPPPSLGGGGLRRGR